MAEMIQYNKCPCCSSAAIHFALYCKDYVVSSETFELWHCEACNFRFIQNAPPENKIGRYYDSEKYQSHSLDSNSLFNKMFQLARKYSVWWRCRLVLKASKKKHGELLDIGSGVGAFAHGIKQYGWHVTALEPDEDARATADTQYAVVAQPMGNLYKLSPKSFDIITLWHVLEHVHDIHDYLIQISQLLKDDGLLIIAVPNFLSVDAKYYKKFWDAYDVPRHLHHFSHTSLLKLASKYGFAITAKKRFWLDAYFASLLSEEHKHGKKRWASATLQGLRSNLLSIADINKSSAITYIFKKR